MPEKWSESKPGEKLLTLYSLLMFSRKTWSLKELSAELVSSKPAVLRLIEQLEGSRFGKVISEKRGREKYFWLDKPKNLPVISLNPDSLRELALCRNFLCHVLPDGVKKNLDNLLLQSGSLVQEGNDGGVFRGLGRAFFKGRIDYSQFGEKLEALIKAVTENRICQLAYQPAWDGGLVKEYDFAPRQITVFHEALYVEGWRVTETGEALYDSPATLAVHRLKSVNLLSRHGSSLPALPERRSFGLIRDDLFEVKIKFSSFSAVYVSEREWSQDEQKVLHSDGSLSLTFQASSETEVVSWLLSFGDEAEILSPDWLRETVREKIKCLIKTYKISPAQSDDAASPAGQAESVSEAEGSDREEFDTQALGLPSEKTDPES
jgi:predicted DNA-binding transcriptional regulator YafY